MIAVQKDSCQITGDVIEITEDMMNILLSLTEMLGREKATIILNFIKTMNSEELFKVNN